MSLVAVLYTSFFFSFLHFLSFLHTTNTVCSFCFHASFSSRGRTGSNPLFSFIVFISVFLLFVSRSGFSELSTLLVGR
ncbi:hypothetical protein EDD21DRAFT_98777 [Dissophora ornata]|nr:hypothetical protein EDD21DRAFT_98777 [Dissophora ornata]